MTAIESHFEKMGARARVAAVDKIRPTRRWNGANVDPRPQPPVRLDVLRDGKGEYFQITRRWDVDVQVIDVQRVDRHLLLLAREADDRKSKFLCGRDERSWFVAAIPESATVRNVQDAKDALKPAEVWESIRAHKIPGGKRDRRWTKAFVRQGEWFFVPRPDLDIGTAPVLKNEPIRRGAGKAHMCQFACRFGGVTVWINSRFPNGLTKAEYEELDPVERKRSVWRTMVRDARVYAKGAIRHPDHKTIWLPGWHQVVMNTETQSRAMSHVAFLD